ncbi:MAG: hypothetical protein NTY88_01470 [Bacteroidetes bacterium]|nr:hypothetical protein [Bacteroidota bacterium]
MKNLLLIILTFVAIIAFAKPGSLDNTFGTHGKVITNLDSTINNGNSMLIQADGKIIVAGASGSNSINSQFALARYNTNGSLDSTFGINGKVVTTIFANSIIHALALQPDGKIIAAGEAHSNISSAVWMAIARYKTDGSLDTTFNGAGFAFGPGGNAKEIAYSVALQNDGKIVVAGDDYNMSSGSYTGLVARFDSIGKRDTSFASPSGYYFFGFGSHYDHLYSTAILPDGKILAAGETRSAGNYDFMLWKLLPNGKQDTTFNHIGFSNAYIDSTHEEQRDMVVQPDGKILLVGETHGVIGGIADMDFFYSDTIQTAVMIALSAMRVKSLQISAA